MAKFKIKTHRQLASEVEAQLNEAQAEKLAKLAKKAKEKAKKGSGGGAGSPQSVATIQYLVELMKTESMKAAAGKPNSLDAAIAAVEKAQAEYPGQLAIRFKSGATCLYSDSSTADYIAFMAAGSKGRWVWHRGWGPDRHPSYQQITVNPAKVLAQAGVSSSWCQHAFLVAD